MDAVRHGAAALKGDSAEHLRRVLRAEPGQRYEISDNGSVYLAEVEGFSKGEVRFRVVDRLPVETPPLRLALLASLIKFDRFEWIVEKATELGVEALVPVVAARSEQGLGRAAARRLERWRRIALEASQQSRRARLPEIRDCIPVEAALALPAGGRWMLDEDREAPPLVSTLPPRGSRSPSDTVNLLAGPEGGWTADERTEAAALGWKRGSLGAYVLRAETAALAGVAVLSAAWLDRPPQ